MKSKGPFGDVPDIGIGFSDAVLVTVSLVGFTMLAVSMYSIIVMKLKSAQEIEQDDDTDMDYDEKLDRADVSTLNRAQRRARAKNRMKKQRRLPHTGPAANGGAIHDENNNNNNNNMLLEGAAGEVDDNNGEDIADHDDARQHMSRKERQKAAKAIEREERRLYEEKRREIQRHAEETARQEKKERERRLAEKKEEERFLREKEEQQQQQTEYMEWKTFVVDTSKDNHGESGRDEPSSSSSSLSIISVQDFLAEAKLKKILFVNEIAERYNVEPKAITERIQQLQKENRITGVLDENGKFVYVSPEEMKAVANYIQKKGRISLKELTSASVDLISMTPPLK